VCAYLHAFTDIIILVMNVRRNCKVFSMLSKWQFIVLLMRTRTFMHACVCVLYMYIYIDAHVTMCVCIHAWHACVYRYATFAHQLIL